MWGNITSIAGAAAARVQKISSEIESQMDAAVGAEDKDSQASKSNIASSSSSASLNQREMGSSGNLAGERAGRTSSDSLSSNSPKITEDRASPVSNIDSSNNKLNDMSDTEINSPHDTYDNNKKSTDHNNNSRKKKGSTTITGNVFTAEDMATVTEKFRSEIKALELKHEADVKVLAEQSREREKKQAHALKEKLKEKIAVAVKEANAAKDDEMSSFKMDFIAEKNDLVRQMEEKESSFSLEISKLKKGHLAELNAEKEKVRQACAATPTPSPTTGNDADGVTSSDQDREEIESLKKQLVITTADFESRIELLERRVKDGIAKLDSANETIAQQSNEYKRLKVSLDEAMAKVKLLEEQMDDKEEELRAMVDSTTSQAEATENLLKDVQSCKEIIANREKALETAAKQSSDLTSQLESAQQKVSDLHAEIAEKDARSKQLHAASVDDGELRKLNSKLQEQLASSTERLTAFETEGKTLAKKQSEMEKSVRKSKADVKEKETEIAKLKESKEQLTKALEQLQDLLKKHENEASSQSKTLGAMQAVSQASTEKFNRLESEIASKAEEIASQRRALENAWADNNELKRTAAEMRAERDDLKVQLGAGTSKAMETEAFRRDVEQREAVLRATNQQLQENLRSHMQEAAIREERLREEGAEMRKRWQDAISSREQMASELSTATAPLLRQISALQDQIRSKGDHWQSIEACLAERAMRAENAVEVVEHKKGLIEEQLNSTKQQLNSLTDKYGELHSQYQTCEMSLERLKRAEAVWLEQKSDMDTRITMEVTEKQSLHQALSEMELRHKVEMNDLVESSSLLSTQKDLENSKLRKALEQINQQLGESKHNGSSSSSGGSSNNSSKNSSKESNGSRSSAEAKGNSEAFISISKPSVKLGSLANGGISFAEAQKTDQFIKQKEDELRSLSQQLQQLQASRNALLDEVSFLSGRNAQLEDQTVALPLVTEEAASLRKRVEVLLVMLGEKDEELEAALSDMKEVKLMYQSHMEDLLEKVVASPANTPTVATSNVPNQTGSNGNGNAHVKSFHNDNGEPISPIKSTVSQVGSSPIK